MPWVILQRKLTRKGLFSEHDVYFQRVCSTDHQLDVHPHGTSILTLENICTDTHRARTDCTGGEIFTHVGSRVHPCSAFWLPQSMFFLAAPLQGVALWSHPFSQSLASFFSCPRSSLLERSLVPTPPLLHLPCAGWFHVFAFPFLSISSLSSFFFASLSFLFCNLLSLFSFILVLRPALSLFTSSLLGLTFSIVAWFSSLPHTYWLLPVRQSLSHFSASLSYAYCLELPQETESNPALMSTKAIATIFSFFPPSLITSSQSCSIPAYLVH